MLIHRVKPCRTSVFQRGRTVVLIGGQQSLLDSDGALQVCYKEVAPVTLEDNSPASVERFRFVGMPLDGSVGVQHCLHLVQDGQ